MAGKTITANYAGEVPISTHINLDTGESNASRSPCVLCRRKLSVIVSFTIIINKSQRTVSEYTPIDQCLATVSYILPYPDDE